MRTLLAAITVLLLFRLAVADTVQQHLENDRAFKLYVATFKVTQAPDGSITDVQLAPVVDVRWQHEHPKAAMTPAQVTIPRRYFATAVKKIRAKRWPLYKRSGKPENFYTYFYYSPQLGDRVIENVHEHE
jgi:hypothetical protein